MERWKLITNPYNWLVVWTMLLIGWFAFHAINKALPKADG